MTAAVAEGSLSGSRGGGGGGGGGTDEGDLVECCLGICGCPFFVQGASANREYGKKSAETAQGSKVQLATADVAVGSVGIDTSK